MYTHIKNHRIIIMDTPLIEVLDSINFYVKESNQEDLGLGTMVFDEETDEAQYLSQVIYQQLMKKKFKENHAALSDNFGEVMSLNDNVLGMHDNSDSVEKVYSDYGHYFSEYYPEYISGILRSSYQKQKDIILEDIKNYNSWDMIKANARTALAEKGKDFEKIMGRLYSIATNYCQIGDVFSAYKNENPAEWARQLMDYYRNNDVIEKIIWGFNIQEEDNSSFNQSMHKINNIINKVRTLNIASGEEIDKNELIKFEKTIYSAVHCGFAMSMKWGSLDMEYSVLSNKNNYDNVVDFLRTETGEQVPAWEAFFTDNEPDAFWEKLNGLSALHDIQLRDENSIELIESITMSNSDRIISNYNLSLSLPHFIFLLSVGHFTWATATNHDDDINIISLMDPALAWANASLGVMEYYVALENIGSFMLGNTAESTTGMRSFSQFLGNLCYKFGESLREVKIIRQLFLFKDEILDMVKPIIKKCFLGLAILGAGLAAYNLYDSIANGNTVDIVFASINMLIAGAAVVASIAEIMAFSAIAGPLGIIVAVAGITVLLAQWIYEKFFKGKNIATSPIKDYTEQVIQANNLEYQDIGGYLCRVQLLDSQEEYIVLYDAQSMYWSPGRSKEIESNTYKYPKSLVISNDSNYIYDFSTLQDARYCETKDLFKTGTDIQLSSEFWTWNPNEELITCIGVAESESSTGDKVAIFLASTSAEENCIAEAYKTKGLTYGPTFEDKIENDENILDVVAVNNLPETMLLFFTDTDIYQVRGDETTIVVENYSQEGSIHNLSAITTGEIINLIYNLTPDDDNKQSRKYHYTITRDIDGNYTNINLLTTLPDNTNLVDCFQDTVVGHFYEKETTDENHPGFKNDGRLDFIYNNEHAYQRYGGEVLTKLDGEQKEEESIMSVTNGIKVDNNPYFTVLFFYKNIFIPKEILS